MVTKAKLLEYGKVAGALTAIVALLSGFVTGISVLSDYRRSVQENTEALRELRREFQTHVEREDELITQLRIAVGALEAAQRYAAARTPTVTVPSTPSTSSAPTSALAEVRTQSAELDLARAALQRATAIQHPEYMSAGLSRP